MWTLRRSREPVLVLRRVLVSGPITGCDAPTHWLTFLGRARQALKMDTRRVRKDVMGP